MWRGKSEGDKNETQGRNGPGQARPRGNPRQGQRGPEGAAPGGRDPRSRATGKKIRRIESGSSVPGQPGPGTRRRSGGGLPSGAPRGPGAPGDQTDIGRPPSAPPRRNQPFDGAGAGRGPSLPPLTQPTGEIPKVPSDLSPDDTVVVSSQQAADGLFGQAPSAAGDAADQMMPSALPSIGNAGDVVADATAAMPAIADRAAGAATGAMPAVGAMPGARGRGAAPQMPSAGPAGPSAGDQALTDPFPDAKAQAQAQAQFAARPAAPAAPQTQAFDSQSMAAAAAVGAPVDARAAARAAREQAAFDAPTDLGGRPAQRRGGQGAGQRPDRGFETKQSDRLQDTEFKLADKRRKQKPKEPNKLVLGLAMALVVLVGVAVAYFLTRGGDDATTETAGADTESEAAADTEEITEAEPLSDTAAPEETPAVPEPVVDEPTLFFDEATTAPLQQGQTYSIDLVGEPEGSLLQVVVDDIPQGQPDAVLPDLILPAGRHSLYIQISNGAEISQSTPVDVYVLGEEPVKGFRANLSSVDIQNEGWAEAVRQFDEYRAAGHEGLQLFPLSPGYWNIFVGGLGEDSTAVQSYCESFSLAVPDDCFGAYYEPTGAPAADETTDTTAEAMTDTTVEAMEDGSTTTSAAGG